MDPSREKRLLGYFYCTMLVWQFQNMWGCALLFRLETVGAIQLRFAQKWHLFISNSFAAVLFQVILGLSRFLFPSSIQEKSFFHDVAHVLSQYMSDPSPFPSCQYNDDVILFTHGPNFGIWDFLWPSCSQDNSEAFMDEDTCSPYCISVSVLKLLLVKHTTQTGTLEQFLTRWFVVSRSRILFPAVTISTIT